MNKIVSLGGNCSVSCVLTRLKLKQASGLFEWFQSINFSDIIKVIELLSEDETKIILSGGTRLVQMNTKSIYSFHYDLEDYRAIFERRKQRFLSDIKNNSNHILFIRKDLLPHTTLKQIQAFKTAIERHNKDLNYKILLISDVSTEADFKPIQDDKLIHRFILTSQQPDKYWRDNEGDINIWKNFMIEAGHDCNPLYDDMLQYNDKD